MRANRDLAIQLSLYASLDALHRCGLVGHCRSLAKVTNVSPLFN
jgi:hypothetical protein